MNKAAENGDFIAAGVIQHDIKQLESLLTLDEKAAYLKARIKAAASEGNYIRAGELQADLGAIIQNGDVLSTSTAAGGHWNSIGDQADLGAHLQKQAPTSVEHWMGLFKKLESDS